MPIGTYLVRADAGGKVEVRVPGTARDMQPFMGWFGANGVKNDATLP